MIVVDSMLKGEGTEDGVQINAVDFFYAAMPEVTLDADGSQDALLVRVRSDSGLEGWGECEASPLVSIAAFVTPRSHGVCQPVAASVLGETIEQPADIARLSANLRRNSMDLLQAAHTWSGVEMALWDLLGKHHGLPVWQLLGYEQNLSKQPYASLLFGATPEETYKRGNDAVAAGYTAVKFGWGGFGGGALEADRDQLRAARDGIGGAQLMVDAGQIWDDDVDAASLRIPLLEESGVLWLEEPFSPYDYRAHAELARRSPNVSLAGGEASHNPEMAKNLIRFGGVRFVQIDTGRVGGIGASKEVADFAAAEGVTYVNHSFTSHLALAASLHAFAGQASSALCEFPLALSPLARAVTTVALEPDAERRVSAPGGPGLGVSVDLAGVGQYLRDVEIRVGGELLTAVAV
ncbi:mandelate racemase/muconate lactonizing enzyme family protein [Leucobacter aridicollis]|uniref:mandelate racemase/muconate lactonizing enzyme family protein n=1 Tax=Leucobacter aridicollis TaxID=283878 RepID=UPI00210660A7|nr:mandelate racemase/muconate lactonizing enzyme family protein [Leucobacter aridicollis]